MPCLPYLPLQPFTPPKPLPLQSFSGPHTSSASFLQQLGPRLLCHDVAQPVVPTAALGRGPNKVLGLFFAAGWNPSSPTFTAKVCRGRRGGDCSGCLVGWCLVGWCLVSVAQLAEGCACVCVGGGGES